MSFAMNEMLYIIVFRTIKLNDDDRFLLFAVGIALFVIVVFFLSAIVLANDFL